MESDLNHKDDLSKETPFLASLKKDNPFHVPENYFEEFPSRMQERMASARQKQPFIPELLARYRWASVTVAVIVAIAFSILLMLNKPAVQAPLADAVKEDTAAQQATQPKVQLAAAEEVVLDEVDEEPIIEQLAKDDVVKKVVGTKDKKHTKTISIDKKELEEYILDNVDESDLL